MRTPEWETQGAAVSAGNTELVASSASPALRKESQVLNMKRTPQPTLTQSKLTSMLQAQSRNGAEAPPSAPTTDSRRAISLETLEMDTSPAAPTESIPTTCQPTATNMAAPPMTAEFFLKALKDNSDHIIKSFNHSLDALSQRIDNNAIKIASNTGAIATLSATSESHRAELSDLANRVASIERGVNVPAIQEQRATLSADYTAARRSLRLWPVLGRTEGELWQNVGEFLHETLAIPENDLGQADIESLDRVAVGRDSVERDEVLVRFYDKTKRDIVASSSASLASKVDNDGRPTAGIRLEIPPELLGTFRLLLRFGTRLRARHGAGTKRHIKFDDFSGSLYTNIKLPGDQAWTRVTPLMAREDLEASLREENAHAQKRMAAKLVPGPRERLNRPITGAVTLAATRSVASFERDVPATAPSGKRPRWSVPDRRRQM